MFLYLDHHYVREIYANNLFLLTPYSNDKQRFADMLDNSISSGGDIDYEGSPSDVNKNTSSGGSVSGS